MDHHHKKNCYEATKYIQKQSYDEERSISCPYYKIISINFIKFGTYPWYDKTIY